MRAITQKTVLTAIEAAGKPISFRGLEYHFIATEERQAHRLEETLKKLHSSKKIEVEKPSQESISISLMFGQTPGDAVFRLCSFYATVPKE